MKKIFIALSVLPALLLSPLPIYADAPAYVVVKGDTLTRIAQKYNTSAKLLMESNQLTSDLIHIGQTLRIPSETTQSEPTYIATQDSSSQIPTDILANLLTSVPAVVPQAAPNQAIVNATILNVRKQPSIDSQIVSKLPNGALVEVVEYGSEWTEIALHEQTAYVATPFITFIASSAASSLSLPSSSLDTNLLEQLKPLLKTPYITGGVTPQGFDCSGFTWYVFQQKGITLPRTSEEQFKSGNEIPYDQILPGDLLFYDTLNKGKVSHVALYLGDRTIIHANGVEVKLEKIENMNKIYPYYGAKRYSTSSIK